MIRSWGQWLLFLSAYAPLFLILAIRSWGDESKAIPFALAALFGVLWIPTSLALEKKKASKPMTVSEVEPRAIEATEYLITYVVAFLPASEPSGKDILSLGVVFIVLGAIYVRTTLLYTNPILFLLGWRIVEMTDSGGKKQLGICRTEPQVGQVQTKTLAPGVVLCP